MTADSYEKTLEALVSEMLGKMGFRPTVSVVREEDSVMCRIELAEDQNFLIGKLGMNLAAIQHLVRILARRQTGEILNIVVDVNNYFSEKKELLEKEAERAFQEVLEKNVSVALRPMQAYERKVVHAYLSKKEGVMTESIGVGAERKIMVRPQLSPTSENVS